MKRLVLVASALALTACANLADGGAGSSTGSPAPKTAWVGAWGASPAPPTPGGAAPNRAVAGRGFENQTVRQTVRITAAGPRVRLRLTNEYGDKPLRIGAASVAIAGASAKPVAVTFAGAAFAEIPRGAAMLSDPVALPVKALNSLAVSLFLPEATGMCTCHPLGTATSEVSGPGDFTAGGFTANEKFANRAFLSAVEVEAGPAAAAIIAFGDSITDGYRSTSDANRRWPDVLAERLAAAGLNRSVVNQAISGNRVLGYQLQMFGEPALARFDRDVLTVPGARWLVILEGVNDIGMGADNPPSAATLIAAYRQIIERAHAHGLKVIGGTIVPYEGAAYYKPAGEAVRGAVNKWIRTGGAFDGVVDFDAAVRDPANPNKMKAELQSGDWLHPNDAGYKAMGEAIDLKLFK